MMQIFILLFYVGSAISGGLSKLSPDEIRWLVPMDEWMLAPNYQAKGKILLFKNQAGVERMFREKDSKSSKLLFSQSWDDLKLADGSQCQWKRSVVPKEVDTYMECGLYFCTLKKGKVKIFADNNVISADFIWTKTNLNNCPYRLPYFIYLNGGGEGYELDLYGGIVLEGINKDKTFAKVNVGNGQSAYLDLSFCKAEGYICKFEDRQKSHYETEIENLRKIQAEKSFGPLNDLIENLLPCVESRDVECIKKYIMKPADTDNRQFIGRYSAPVVDDQMILELRSCLQYDHLLPHLLASRGEKRVCIFESTPGSRPPSGNTKLYPLTYPEAVRRSSALEWKFSVKD